MRFHRKRLDFDGPAWELPGLDGDRVVALRVAQRDSNGEFVHGREARHVSLTGSGYATEEEARATGEVWMDHLRPALARVNIGADLGARGPQTFLTESGLQLLNQHPGRRVLQDHSGLMTFECDPEPMFIRLTADVVVLSPIGRVDVALRAARAEGVQTTEREKTAYSLYAASFALDDADARFVTLVMAVETLLEPGPRESKSLALVEQMIEMTRDADLKQDDKNSLIGSLTWLRSDSISRTGKRLAAERLADRHYMNQPAPKFFQDCYAMRSKLIHGDHPRPTYHEVNVTAAELERFVADLLSGPLLNTVQSTDHELEQAILTPGTPVTMTRPTAVVGPRRRIRHHEVLSPTVWVQPKFHSAWCRDCHRQ